MKIKTLVKQALTAMLQGGASPNTVKGYRTSGLGKIVRHFEDIGQDDYSSEIVKSFVETMRIKRETGYISQHTWTIIRRSGELLELFFSTETLTLPTLMPWEVTNNPLRIEVTDEQLADNDNILGLVRRSELSLDKFNLLSSTKHNYRRDGFDCILRRHIEAGVTIYSKDITNQLIAESYEKYKQGLLGISAYQTVRRMAVILDDIHKTGNVKPFIMSRSGQHKPTAVFAEILEQFCVDAKQTGKIKNSTLGTRKSAIRGFIFELEYADYTSFDDVTLKTVNACISRLLPKHTGGTSCLLNSISSFLKYLYETGLTAMDLSVALPKSTAVRRTARQGFSTDEIDKLLACPDCSTPLGKRNYAIMTLAAQTGLRAIDVVNLKRHDIDWRGYEIRTVQQKTAKPLVLSLEPEVGNAIADYLLNGRPKSELPYVFIVHSTQKRPLKSESVRSFIKRYMLRLQIDTSIPRRGFHSFRRTFGTRMLESEISLDMLRQLLGQAHMDSVKPYISIHEQGLKKCALGLVPLRKEGDAI